MTILDGFVLLIVFILGSTIGSFLNVCIYRIPAKISIVKPRSRCGSCGTTLSAIDLVPIFSWIFLRGKCRTCGTKISSRYAIVELITGLIFVWILLINGVVLTTPILWVFFSFLIVVFFIDLDHMIIPNKVVFTGMVLGLFVLGVQIYEGYPLYMSDSAWSFVLGPLVPMFTMLALAMASMIFYRAGGLGMGDVKVYLPIGMFLGWRLSLLSLWFAFLFGGLFGMIWIFILKRDKKANIPFGPFIVLGAMISALYGLQILSALFNR